MKKQPRTQIKDLVDSESKFRAIDTNEQRKLDGGALRATAPSLSFGSVGSRMQVVSSCTACGDCDCD